MSLPRPVLALAVALLAAAPSTAAAQSTASIELSSAGKRALKPLSLSPGKLSVKQTTVTSSATLTLDGSLRFKNGRRTAGATKLRLTVGRTSSYVSARLSRKTVRLLTVRPTAPATLDPARGAVTLTGARIALTSSGAKALRTAFKLKRTPSTKTLGTLSVRVAPQATAPTTPGASQPATPDGSAPTTCKLSTGAGKPPALAAGEPPVKARPAGARTITGATLTWRVRETFINYIATGEGTTPSGGATGGAAESLNGGPPLVYNYGFPFASGWCDPSTGAARVTFKGTVAFRYAGHGIDLVVNDPEVELDGPTSRVIFRMTGSGDTAGGNQRQVVETLEVSKATVRAEGNGFAYERIPAFVPPGDAAGSIFAGYYLPGDPFGSVSISYTTD